MLIPRGPDGSSALNLRQGRAVLRSGKEGAFRAGLIASGYGPWPLRLRHPLSAKREADRTRPTDADLALKRRA
jgi:hypothetical protein